MEENLRSCQFDVHLPSLEVHLPSLEALVAEDRAERRVHQPGLIQKDSNAKRKFFCF